MICFFLLYFLLTTLLAFQIRFDSTSGPKQTQQVAFHRRKLVSTDERRAPTLSHSREAEDVSEGSLMTLSFNPSVTSKPIQAVFDCGSRVASSKGAAGKQAVIRVVRRIHF